MLINQPLKIRNKTLRNRIIMPPMQTGKPVNGALSDEQIKYYQERSLQTAMIIVEHEYISKEGIASSSQLSIADNTVIERHKQLTDAIHKNGALVLAQISHAGGIAKDIGLPIIAPSAFTTRDNLPVPKEMSQDDLTYVKQCFVDAALRAKKAGFDGVEVHGAHGYLLNQFYSPITNHRTDAYNGNTIEGRTHFQTEILKEIRKAAGSDFILAFRFGACDYMEGGSEIKDIPVAAKLLESSGIDLLDISGGLCGTSVKGRNYPGYFSDSSKAAKDAVQIPVMLTGGIQTGDDAEKLLSENVADVIGVGRSMMKNPAWTQQALHL